MRQLLCDLIDQVGPLNSRSIGSAEPIWVSEKDVILHTADSRPDQPSSKDVPGTNYGISASDAIEYAHFDVDASRQPDE